MQSYDVLIIGGGPAGSSCARELVQGGLAVAVLERDEFPRTKLCAGWITPEVVADLELDPASYPHRFNTFDHLVMHIRGLSFRLKTVQHSIRRYEFDHYLLKRSGAVVHQHNVREIERDEGDYVIDGQYRARYLVGAAESPEFPDSTTGADATAPGAPDAASLADIEQRIEALERVIFAPPAAAEPAAAEPAAE